MGGRPPLARVYVHDADLGDGGGGGEAGMPLDDFNDPYARKQAILRGLGLDTGGRAPDPSEVNAFNDLAAQHASTVTQAFKIELTANES